MGLEDVQFPIDMVQIFRGQIHSCSREKKLLSHEQRLNSYFPLHCFFNSDPYIILVYNFDPYINGFSTFDLSARETSHTTGQHLHDSRALKRNKTRETTWRSHEKKWSKKLLCTLPRPSIRTRNELPPTRIALAFVSPIKSWKWSQGCWCRLTSTLRSVKVTPHRLICCFAMHQCRTSLQAYWL